MVIKKEEPIFFQPIYKDYIWGGNNLGKILNRNIPKNTAESWEVSAHQTDSTIIQNGKYQGKRLLDVFETNNNFFTNNEKFPVLIKFIDASDKLSIQVHPNDEYANKYENDNGKNEVWYIMDCKEDAKLIYGLNQKKIVGKTNEEIVSNIKEYVEYVDVKKGDFIQIPAGTVHAILDGIVLCEIQQNSNVTYRIWDWDRVGKDGKPRELHKQKAIDVISKLQTPKINNYDNSKQSELIYKNNDFTIETLIIDNTYSIKSNQNNSEIFILIEGKGKMKFNDCEKDIEVGTVFLNPINCIDVHLTGKLKFLRVKI